MPLNHSAVPNGVIGNECYKFAKDTLDDRKRSVCRRFVGWSLGPGFLAWVWLSHHQQIRQVSRWGICHSDPALLRGLGSRAVAFGRFHWWRTRAEMVHLWPEQPLLAGYHSQPHDAALPSTPALPSVAYPSRFHHSRPPRSSLTSKPSRAIFNAPFVEALHPMPSQ